MNFRNKRNSLIFLVVSLLITTGTTLYYKGICVSGVCSQGLIENLISPIELGGYLTTLYGLFFVLLPSGYFNSWFKYIFSWAFPLSIVLVNILHSETSWLVISKTDVVRLMGMVFGVVTVIFIITKWYLSRR